MQDLLDKIGWSQRTFAGRLGVSPDTVYRWCKRGGGPGFHAGMAYLRMVGRVLG